jgi:hypothetical protein
MLRPDPSQDPWGNRLLGTAPDLPDAGRGPFRAASTDLPAATGRRHRQQHGRRSDGDAQPERPAPTYSAAPTPRRIRLDALAYVRKLMGQASLPGQAPPSALPRKNMNKRAHLNAGQSHHARCLGRATLRAQRTREHRVTYEDIKYETDERLAFITLNRPEKLNALSDNRAAR